MQWSVRLPAAACLFSCLSRRAITPVVLVRPPAAGARRHRLAVGGGCRSVRHRRVGRGRGSLTVALHLLHRLLALLLHLLALLYLLLEGLLAHLHVLAGEH